MRDGGSEQTDVYIQKRDLAPAYILTAITSTCRMLVLTISRPVASWNIFKSPCQVVSEAFIDEKVSQLQAIQLQEEKWTFAYSNRSKELLSECISAELSITEFEKESTLSRGITQ